MLTLPKHFRLGELPFLRHFTLISLVSVLILNISVLEFGFDNSLLSLVQAMDTFDVDFGMYQGHSHHKMNPEKLSQLGALGTPCRAVFILAALFIGERYGRWVVFVLMQLGSVTGVVIMFTARTFHQVLAGRMVLSAFSGWHDWLIPMYMAEIVPSPIRGAVIASYMGFSYFGSFFASVSAFASTHAYNDARQYHVPMGLMFVAPGICLAFCWALPESPRWLVRKGKMDKAIRALYRLNGSKAGYSPEEEARLLKESVDADTLTEGRWMDVFKGTNKRRTVISLFCIFLVQFTGQSFVTKYGTIFVKGLGTMDPMAFGMLERGLGIIGPIFLALTIERLGRRSIFLGGAFLYSTCLCLIGGIGTLPGDQVKDGIIALYIMSAILHIISFHGVCMIVSAEIPHLRLRDKTLAVAYVVSSACETGVAYSLPYLLYTPGAGLESKVGFIFGGISFLGIIWGYFYLPETTGRSLEEMEELWHERVPPRKFGSYVTKSSVGLRISKLERHAGAGLAGDSSEEDLGRDDDEEVKEAGVVYHEEVVMPKK